MSHFSFWTLHGRCCCEVLGSFFARPAALSQRLWQRGAVIAVNSGSTKDRLMQRCLQQLWFISTLHDFELHARHIPGDHNLFADALSRWHISSHQAKILELSTGLGISYSFQQLPGDFTYFDVDWHSTFTRSFLLGSHAHVPFWDVFTQRLLHHAFAESTHRNIKSYVNVYTRFCNSVACSPFPVEVDTLPGRTFKHVNQPLGFDRVWDTVIVIASI